ncbi:putative ATPase [Lachnotalea glycerini]|jgi:predicted ATPase|uniref:ATP-binding cassette domain-containing protein n=1 Tax=Lachnotalea glycerini TaxID=1763509 RepID=A0A255I0V4_9FIRM|nr:AAA family ATPase [Lachnotalea glycerini]PXV86662.1 putative ATPase [Lachnotalea glycerini]RDY32166.1 ATP-binding cassette domain-containing protein [Lachnotalea glycerini]
MNNLFLQNICIDWNKISNESYLRLIPALSSLTQLSFNENITFFVGENGSGKSTLLEGIAVAYGFNAEGGTLNYNFSTYESHSELHNAINLSKGFRKAKSNYFLRAESFYNVASKAEDYRDGDPKEIYYARYGGKSLHEQSHGESFLALIEGNFVNNGFYILDEPEAALSPQRQLSLLIDIVNLSKAGSQFIIASHSPILLGIPNSNIVSFDDEKIHSCTYEETDSYQITEMFVNNRERLLNSLLSDS